MQLSQVVRQADVIARFGGDEFVIFQADLSDPAGAGILAARLLASLEEHLSIDHNDIHITISIGIAVFNSSIAMLDAMLRQADLALYRAKDEGRNRYCFYSPELDEQACERGATLGRLATAV